MRNAPSSTVVAIRTSLVSTLVTVIFASGTVPPEASFTTPRIAPLLCADAGIAEQDKARNIIANEKTHQFPSTDLCERIYGLPANRGSSLPDIFLGVTLRGVTAIASRLTCSDRD